MKIAILFPVHRQTGFLHNLQTRTLIFFYTLAIFYYHETHLSIGLFQNRHCHKFSLGSSSLSRNKICWEHRLYEFYVLQKTKTKIGITGTVMQIEKAVIDDRLRASKVSWKFHIPTIFNFAVIYP